MELKVIDYLKNNQFEGVPVAPGQKAAEYIFSRIKDYYEDSDDCKLFSEAFVNGNEYLNMLSFYEKVKSIDNKSGLDEFVLYAFKMLDTDLNDNIVNNMELACTQYYDSLLSSDIEFLLINAPYDEVIQYCNCSGSLEEFCDEKVVDTDRRVALAVRLNDFYKDYDYYDYTDKVDGTEQDVIYDLVAQLNDFTAVNGILNTLKEIKEESEPSDEQSQVLDSLIEEVANIQSFFKTSLDGRIADAVERSEATDKDIITKENLGKEFDG